MWGTVRYDDFKRVQAHILATLEQLAERSRKEPHP